MMLSYKMMLRRDNKISYLERSERWSLLPPPPGWSRLAGVELQPNITNSNEKWKSGNKDVR